MSSMLYNLKAKKNGRGFYKYMINKNYKTDRRCVATGVLSENGNCLHHIYTKKAFPEYKDKDWNLMPLSLVAHNEVHKKGMKYFAEKYLSVKQWLLDNGWEQDFRGRWVHTKGDL